MRFTHAPRPIPADLYDAAAREYARRVGSRAVAIYRVGTISRSGISDLDLLVIPRSAHTDNGRWFSVRSHLPPALRAPFRYDPDFVPLDHVDALRFTTHVDRRLIHGEDVAAGVQCLETPEQRWSMVFERLCALDRYHGKTSKRRRAHLWRLVSKTKSIGISLADVDSLTGSSHADRFVSEVEDLRAGFFDLDAADAGARCWALFDRGLACMESSLTSALGLDTRSSLVDFARRFLHGEASIPGLCEDALAERREAVLHAQRAAFALGCGGADLFTAVPYAKRIGELEKESRAPLRRRVSAFAAYAVRDARIRLDAGIGGAARRKRGGGD